MEEKLIHGESEKSKIKDISKATLQKGESGTPVIVGTEPQKQHTNTPTIEDVKSIVKKEELESVDTEDVNAKTFFASDEIEFSKESGKFGTNAAKLIKELASELKTGCYIINDNYDFEYIGYEDIPQDYTGPAIYIGDDGIHYLENYNEGTITSQLEISTGFISIDSKPVVTEPNLTNIEEVEVDLRGLTEEVMVNIEDLMNGKDIVIVRQRNSGDYSYFINFPINSMFLDPAIFKNISTDGTLENMNDKAFFSLNEPANFRIVKLGVMYFISFFAEV